MLDANVSGPMIVGLDGSEASHAALAWAVQHTLADQPIHVVHAFAPLAELAMAAAQQDWTSQRQRRERDLDHSWVAHARENGVVAYTSIVGSDPADALLAKARACEGSMIVVGPHGSGHRASLGRVTRSLLHELDVPVVVARPVGATGRTGRPGRVVAAVGYGQEASSPAMWGAAHADRFGLPLELVHVIGRRPIVPLASPSDMLASYLGGSLPEEFARSELEELSDAIALQYPDLEVEIVVRRGSVVREMLAQCADVNLIVLGRSRMEPLTRNIYASRTLGIVSEATASVVVVPS